MRKKYWLLIPLLLIIGFVGLFSKNELWTSNAKLLKEKMHAELSEGDQVKLSEFTPFEWDEVYSFNPYSSKEIIYETIGYKWDDISETVSEGMNQIVFMKAGEVVCYIYGYPESNGNGIFFLNSGVGEDYTRLNATDQDVFSVEIREEIVYLSMNRS